MLSRSTTRFTFALLAPIAACHSADKAPESAPPPAPATASAGDAAADPVAAATFDPSLHVDIKASTKTPSGLYYRDLAPGDGPVIQRSQVAAVNYTGWFVDGKQFDSSAGKDPYPVVLGAARVIPGWEEGLQGMKAGGMRQLIIPPSLGYGDSPPPGMRASAVLVFTVELVSIK